MTRKDYELIAKVLGNYSDERGVVTERDEIANQLATAFAMDNPRFDSRRFLVASGVIKA